MNGTLTSVKCLEREFLSNRVILETADDRAHSSLRLRIGTTVFVVDQVHRFGQIAMHLPAMHLPCHAALLALAGTPITALASASMFCSTIVDERQCHGKRRNRRDLSNGIPFAPAHQCHRRLPNHAQGRAHSNAAANHHGLAPMTCRSSGYYRSPCNP